VKVVTLQSWSELILLLSRYEIIKGESPKTMVASIHDFIMRNFRNSSGIIYCNSRKKVEELAIGYNKSGKMERFK
jgi:superfamily II DNA helicase RecQ